MAQNILHTETVAHGDKAKWPFEDGYEEPTKSGYLFDGWEYNGTKYTPPFYESSNPFGPITSATDIKAKWDKLTIHADTNHTLISGDGDTDDNLTKLLYWVTSSKGNVITSGMSIEDVDLDKGMLPISFEDKGTAVEDNKNVKKLKAAVNDVNLSRYYRFKAKYPLALLESDIIEIEQAGKDQTVLPDFDFLTFVYNWDAADGKDLDTATFIDGTNIKIETTNKLLDNYPVGFGCKGSSGIDPDYTSSGSSSDPQLFAEISQYIKGAGDNQQAGKESALINWKEICNRDFITQGITKIYCELYANWYVSRGSGNCTVDFQTWKTEDGAGGMKLDRDASTGKTLYTFSPTGDTVAKTTATISGNVYAFSLTNAGRRNFSPTGDEKGYYSHVATLIYDVRSRSALLLNKMNAMSGRNIYSVGIVNGETYNGGNDGRLKTISNEISNSSYSYVINITELYNMINGTKKNVYVKENDIEISYYAWSGGTKQEGFVSFTVEKDSNNYVNKINVNVQQNTSGQPREGDVLFRGQCYLDGSGTEQTISMRYEFKQNP